MKRAGKKKSGENRRPVEMSLKQLDKHLRDAAEEAVCTTGTLYCAVLADKYKWSEDEIAELYEEISRYLKYIDEKALRLREVAAILERKTGIKIKCRW